MRGIHCENCDTEFDPVATRWRCTACGARSHCCEGEAQPVCGVVEQGEPEPIHGVIEQ